MVVMEILTGIALVQKSVSFIKENISTVKDIKGIAQQIDGFFTGESQMNKKQGKGMSLAQQFGSVESSATDFIDRKLLEEQRQALKVMINLRFGPTAWDEIITERANKIAEAREASRLQRIEASQRQKEFIDTLQTVGIAFCLMAVLIMIFLFYFKAYAKDYTRQQKIQKGIIVLPTMTTCRLKKRKVYKDKMACIYQGAQKTFTLDFTDIANGCPRKYKCVLDPNGKQPSIDSVMESLRSIAK